MGGRGGGADDERGAESRQPAPLNECAAARRITKWGSGGGSEEKKLNKKKKWETKRYSGFGWYGAPVTGSGSRAALVGLGERDRGAPVGWVHFL
jgi:hypothetical protein